MQKFVIAGLGLLLASAVVLAQGHENATEKVVKQRIAFATDTRVGTEVLKAGEYRVMCDRTTITFQGSHGVIVKVPCQGTEMKAPAAHNEIHTSPGDGGSRVLTKLLLKGSNIEHTFD